MKTNKIWGMLENIPDPEIPNVSIVEMGIVRGIEYNHDTLNVIITPTYSGCPAIDLIKREIKQNLIMKGINDFEITLEASSLLLVFTLANLFFDCVGGSGFFGENKKFTNINAKLANNAIDKNNIIEK